MPEYTLTRHRGKWAVTFRQGEKRKRVSTGTADRAEAESIASVIWQRHVEPESERIADLWPAYVRDRIGDGAFGPRYGWVWTALEPFFGHRHASTITRMDCRAYAEYRKGKANSTIKTELALLRACVNWAGIDATFWLPPPSAPRDRWLTKDQARELLAATETPHIKLFITIGLATGARARAILDLTWQRVDFDAGTINFRSTGRETNKRRTIVPMNENAREALEEAVSARMTDHVIEYAGKPVASVKRAISRLRDRTGIDVSPHILRHSAAVWMAQADVPMQKIAQYLGHTSTRVTEETYARYSPSFLKDAGDATTL